MIVAIDGPAGSGKTTVAKLLAKRIGFDYLDTGATYRALTLKALELGVDLSKEEDLGNLARSLDLRLEGSKTYLDGKDVSLDIRKPRINQNISIIVSYPRVRETMVSLQREIAKVGDFVVEGRDITTVVFPNAECKFYLDADFKVRSQRRFDEFKEKGIHASNDDVDQDLSKRDHADMNREVGALKKADDATVIDTTYLSIEEVVEKLSQHVDKKRNE